MRNGQLLVLRSGKDERRLRLFTYKVTGSSRRRPDERRIEITSTYKKGLKRLPDYEDVVLGVYGDHDTYVGVDPRRIAHGGPTGNASSFFDRDGLDLTKKDEILVRPRVAKLFPDGLEFHAFLKPQRLSEYLFNFELIHSGSYSGNGLYSDVTRLKRVRSIKVSKESAAGDKLILDGPRVVSTRPKVKARLVEAYERGDRGKLRRTKLTREQLFYIQRRAEENGNIGEEIVLNFERRNLRRADKESLAKLVRRISQQSVGEGYDILSFDLAGDEKWIEVKSTSGHGYVFEMSENEWQKAKRGGDKYYIYRVTRVRTKPQIKIFRNPGNLERKGLLVKAASGWLVTLR